MIKLYRAIMTKLWKNKNKLWQKQEPLSGAKSSQGLRLFQQQWGVIKSPSWSGDCNTQSACISARKLGWRSPAFWICWFNIYVYTRRAGYVLCQIPDSSSPIKKNSRRIMMIKITKNPLPPPQPQRPKPILKPSSQNEILLCFMICRNSDFAIWHTKMAPGFPRAIPIAYEQGCRR